MIGVVGLFDQGVRGHSAVGFRAGLFGLDGVALLNQNLIIMSDFANHLADDDMNKQIYQLQAANMGSTVLTRLNAGAPAISNASLHHAVSSGGMMHQMPGSSSQATPAGNQGYAVLSTPGFGNTNQYHGSSTSMSSMQPMASSLPVVAAQSVGYNAGYNQQMTNPGISYSHALSNPQATSLLDLKDFILPEWKDLTVEQKAYYAKNQQQLYKSQLGDNVSLEVDQKVNSYGTRLVSHLNNTERALQIESIKKGFAIPSFAPNIEIVNIPVTVSLNSAYKFASQLVIPPNVHRSDIFGSIDAYGQGNAIQMLSSGPGMGYKYLGRLNNTFICKIELSNIRSACNCPVGVKVGENDKAFAPYADSMKYVTLNGERFHYIIPPKADIAGPVAIYLNSKDAEHEFGYYYADLTADVASIVKDKQLVENKQNGTYQYALTHPIARYLCCYASRDGFKVPPIMLNDGIPVIEVKFALANEIARRIVELIGSSIPTRNLAKFDILLGPVQFENQYETVVNADPLTVLTKQTAVLQELAEFFREQERKKDPRYEKNAMRGYGQMTMNTQPNYPVSFTVSMTYIFRDEASVIYEQALKGG